MGDAAATGESRVLLLVILQLHCSPPHQPNAHWHQELRPAIIALRAFNVETARIADAAKSEPLILMRTQVRRRAADAALATAGTVLSSAIPSMAGPDLHSGGGTPLMHSSSQAPSLASSR